jgi:membrane fusion protein (multidrug efflux system)
LRFQGHFEMQALCEAPAEPLISFRFSRNAPRLRCGLQVASSIPMLFSFSRVAMLLAALFAVAACNGADQPAAASAAAPPPTVAVVQVAPESVEVGSEWIATLDGLVNAQIRPQVSGYLIARQYREGTQVRKGDVLFEIDARPFAALLAQAEAQLARAQAELGRTERDVQRNTPLAQEHAIPQSQLDNDIQANLAARAAVTSAEATGETARLNLGFTKVRSLIDGVAAIATAQIGDLVGPATLLTTVSQLNPIRAYFSLSEREYLLIAPRLNRASAAKGLWGTGGELKLRLSDGTEYPRRGVFVAADRQIDPRTGTIRISATFPNPDRILRPGQYGRVEATTQHLDGALLVPQRAVSELQGATQLRVVDAANKVRIVTVTLGSRVGSRWIVTRGLEPGARVIVDSTPVGEGTVVTVHPYAPAAGEQ